jgi:hypothetical protein
MGASRTRPHNTPQQVTEKGTVPIGYSLHSFILQQKTICRLFIGLLNDVSELLFIVEW